ncbi:hypothetical protein ACQKWADRAFT_295261 [Trichoderma austrokoningii]
MSDPHLYTVGWICALSTEYVAAQAFLDESHPLPENLPPTDSNTYKLGRIGHHNVVIAVLPNGEYGLSSATGVAKDLLRSFPNIRIGLMVGIGGGAPSAKHDIRLGDVVVAVSSGQGAVIQYDFGKIIQGEEFQESGYLNQAPILLRTAVNSLKAEYELDLEGNQIQRAIDSALAKRPRLRRNYQRPDESSDRLYQSLVIHPAEGEADCFTVCGNDPSTLIERHQRGEDEDNPAVHFGLIASANTLIKDAVVRDSLIARKNILCFEMEAAGLMNHFPCLVIRGICDYSDSHKNKAWQGYAAMAAAAYAKDILSQIAPSRIEAEQKISEAVLGLQSVIKEHRDIAKEQLQIHKDLAAERLSDKERACHQLFRLTSDSKDATYEWYKDRVEERAENTCLWFLLHDNFRKWKNQESGPLLVTADPGCGKSVLAKYLIDHELSQSATICYFFFKDQDQNTCRQAVCALLHQLFAQKPALIKYAMPQFNKDGQGLSKSTTSLWKILRDATTDPNAGPITIVLDALDECADSEFLDLIRNVKTQFHHGCPGNEIKYLLTCRPYEQITSQFHSLLSTFPDIRIPGEEESDAISQEINHVITHRINKLSTQKNLNPEITRSLTAKLQSIPHRTYLWVYLTFEHLEEGIYKKTKKGIESTIATLPSSITETYERILNKSQERQTVQKALSIVLAANRPLTLAEMNVAINVMETSDDLDLEDIESFKLRIRSLCGLFIAIHHSKIYFLHQTAREFLLTEIASSPAASSSNWQHSISLCQAHNTLAKACIIYLDLFNSNGEFQKDIEEIRSSNGDLLEFLDYAAENWVAHSNKADISDDAAILPRTMRICDPNSKSRSLWFPILGKKRYLGDLDENTTELTLASRFGLTALAELCLGKGYDIETAGEDGVTPLLQAVLHDNAETMKMLIEKGADIEATFQNGDTSLLWVVFKGYEEITKILLDKGADVEATSHEGWTPLTRAAAEGHEGIVKMLIEKGADIEATEVDGETPLLCAASQGHEGIVKMLLEKGANVEATDYYGRTPLLVASTCDEAVVKMLLDKGANIEATDSYGRTPLMSAASEGYERIVEMLLENGANINAIDNQGQTSLRGAASEGHGRIVKILRDKGAGLEIEGRHGS